MTGKKASPMRVTRLAYDDCKEREEQLRNRARALTDADAWRRARYHLLCIQLLSRAVPEEAVASLAVEGVRVVRRRVIVHRDLRLATRQCILRNGWDFAVTRIPAGAKSDEFATLSGWSWHYPDNLPRTALLPSDPLIRDVVMLKGKHGFKGQDRRLATLTGARLNDEVVRLAVSPDEPGRKKRVRLCELPPNFGVDRSPPAATWRPNDIDPPQFAGQSWGLVGEEPDIAARSKRETDRLDAIAQCLLDGLVTEKQRIADLNARHRATFEAIVGESTHIPPPTKSHPATDMGNQSAALDMVFTEGGFGVWERRNRHNDLLEPTAKLDKRGKRYFPNRAGPGRRLTSEALIAAIAELRPAKKGWPYTKPYPRGDETGLFTKCQRAGRKQASDYTAYDDLADLDAMYRQWDKSKTQDTGALADRNRLKPLIDIPEGWTNNSFAEEVMSFRSKNPGWDWGNLPFDDRISYSRYSLNEPVRVGLS